MDLTTKVEVKNRGLGSTAYKIDSLRVSRYWSKEGDIINIPINELIELTTIPGGKALMDNFLLIEDKDALETIYGTKEMIPEYNYSQEEIDYLLYKGTNEQLLDALDYAPLGVLDLIKSTAIKNIPDTTAKVEAINNKFGITLSTIAKNYQVEDGVAEEEITSERRSAPVSIKTEEKPKPKVESKYKVTSRS